MFTVALGVRAFAIAASRLRGIAATSARATTAVVTADALVAVGHAGAVRMMALLVLLVSPLLLGGGIPDGDTESEHHEERARRCRDHATAREADGEGTSQG